jgi:type IV secretory pathway VirD2 relaxase
MAKTRRPKREKVALPHEGNPEGDEPKFRIRPQRPRTSPHGDIAWSVALKTVFRYARSSRRPAGNRGASRTVGSTRTGSRTFDQRCAVRVTYSPNKTSGQWRAHGVYIARESATQDPTHAGFGHAGRDIDVADTLREWQASGDERIWKIIISPELGDRLDLERLTRDLVKQAERDLGTPLEWVAITHFNTEHPHAHLVVRGRRSDGVPLTLPRAYVQHGLRQAAGAACTLQLGPRTELDAIAAEEREVNERRYTSLDRTIERLASVHNNGDAQHFHIEAKPSFGADDTRQQHVRSRLMVLQTMGLAEPIGSDAWRVRRDFQTVLRAIQRANDRQKMISGKGSLLSDERLQLVVTNVRRVRDLQGRVLIHGEEEHGSGASRHYLLLEGTDDRIHLLYYTPEMEEARSRGKLRVNNFVRLRRQFVDGQPLLEVDDRGDANAALKNKAFLSDAAQRLIKRGIIPTEEGWGGWLGAYQRAVRQAAIARDTERLIGKQRPNER